MHEIRFEVRRWGDKPGQAQVHSIVQGRPLLSLLRGGLGGVRLECLPPSTHFYGWDLTDAYRDHRCGYTPVAICDNCMAGCDAWDVRIRVTNDAVEWYDFQAPLVIDGVAHDALTFDRAAYDAALQAAVAQCQPDELRSAGRYCPADAGTVAGTVISVHEAEVRVAFSTTGRHAVTASADGFVRVIDLASGAAVAEHRIDLGDADNSIDELGVDEAANPWVRSTDDLWPLPPARTPPAKPPRAFSMQIKDGRGRLELKSSPWDVLASSEWMPFPEEDYCNVLGEVLHHDGDATRYIVHRESHPVQTWERQGDRLTLVGDFCPPLPDDVEPDELRLCPQRRHLLTKYWADPIHVRRLPPDRRAGWRQVNTGHFGWFKMSDFDATGQVVLTHSWDRSLRVTDIDAGRPIHVLAGHGGPIVSSCFSPDGRWVLSGSMDKTARLWKLGM